MDIGNALPIMFNNQDEVDFLRKNLRLCDTVLEYGSGGSTLEIAKHVKQLYSIEHNKEWYDKVKALMPNNVGLHYEPRNKQEKSGHDGTLEDYKNYVNAPFFFLPDILYDVIFIDGRARVACAKCAVSLLKPDGIILIHDYRNPTEIYRRYEYEVVEQFLDCIDGAYALWKFKPKK